MEYEAATVDVCEKSLENVWSVVLVAGIFEIIQNVFNMFNSTIGIILPWNWFFMWFGETRFDLGAGYAYSSMADIALGRTYLRCSASAFEDIKLMDKDTFSYENEISYYLNAVETSQEYYLAFSSARFLSIFSFIWEIA